MNEEASSRCHRTYGVRLVDQGSRKPEVPGDAARCTGSGTSRLNLGVRVARRATAANDVDARCLPHHQPPARVHPIRPPTVAPSRESRENLGRPPRQKRRTVLLLPQTATATAPDAEVTCS